MEPITLFKQTNFSNTIWWKLKINISGYQNETDNNLVTEILKNRIFRLIYPNSYKNKKNFSRILVQLYEDGYFCWINLDKLIIKEFDFKNHNFLEVDELLIQQKIPLVLKWIEDQSNIKNNYLWGGTLGPNFDCSGLIQTAFLMHQIFIPRDSYQIRNFCKHLFYFKESFTALEPGDLLFFGNENKCDHI